MSLRLKLYNTLTREKADFQPIDADDVRMYVCGPTVYDFAHIGNARPVIVFDVLYRLLRHVYGEAHVTYARNITDVDDKINARALRDYPNLPLNEAIHAVTEKTAQQFHDDVAMLGCLEPTIEPRATDNIPQMIEIIEKLIARGHAYVASGEVLFDTKSMGDYGQLSKRPLDEQQAGARIAVEVHKKNPGDFVLWKLSSHNEPGWESPWGRGRPGWHIECSAMSGRYLGEVFDIHGGGLDLIFPHHENEIAQSRCAHGTHVMANVWMHNGFVQVEGRKMSKSDGNFITIYELLHTDKFGGRQWPGEVLRLAMLMTHYREPIDFSVKRLEEAERRLTKWTRAIASLSPTSMVADPDEEFTQILANDLDTHSALSWLDKMSGYASENLSCATKLAQTMVFLGIAKDVSYYSEIQKRIDTHFANVSNDLRYASKEVAVGDVIIADGMIALRTLNETIENRLEMLNAKNFAEADRIRDELSGKGIQLKDGKDKESGERVTTWEIKR